MLLVFTWKNCEFFSICLEAALRELKSLLTFLILQLQTLLQHKQFFTLMRRLNLVSNCTFYNMNPLEPTSKAEALKRQCNFVKSYVIKTTFQQAEETEAFPLSETRETVAIKGSG